jgi:hypothetical protein
MDDGMSLSADIPAALPLGSAPPAAAAPHVHTSNDEAALVADVERLRRYVATAKDIQVTPESLDGTTQALQAAKAQLAGSGLLDLTTESRLIAAVNALTPKIYPVTLASLEIADIMEIGNSGLSPRQQQIREQVNRLVTWWVWIAIFTLILVFLTSGINEGKLKWDYLADYSQFFNPIILGFLGSCAFILRNVLQGLANKTFILRDGNAYALRSILGMILGYMIPRLYSAPDPSAGLLTSVAIPFLAGYAVEPMFAALDNLVLTLRDAVSRSPAPGGTNGK